MAQLDWPLLAGLDDAQRAEILAVARRRTFRRGEVVVHRGDPADTVHLIVKGRFAVRIGTPLGDTATLAVLGRGETFGELALVGGQRRTATVAALEAAETRSLHQHDFDALRRRHPQASDALIELLAAQVQRLSRQLVEALYLPAEQRVVLRVQQLAELYRDDGGAEVEIPLTQEDIAGLAGTARATVNRVLRACEERGLVRLRRGRTVVLDADALAKRAPGLL